MVVVLIPLQYWYAKVVARFTRRWGRELLDRGKHRRQSLYPEANDALLQRRDEAMRALIQRLRILPRLLQHPYAVEMSVCPPLECIVYCNVM